MIPEFNNDGYLPIGNHVATGAEFVERYCASEPRKALMKAVTDILDFAARYGAKEILFGGSFVTRTDAPNDIDCMVIFAECNQIPDRIERVEIDDTKLDIQYASLDQPELVEAIARLFAQNRRERPVGVVTVKIEADDGKCLWEQVHPSDGFDFEIIKTAYINRQLSNLVSQRALITVHGIKSNADWNGEVCHIASSRGWIVAPFVYGKVGAAIFTNPRKREEIVARFRDHVADIKDRYSADLSVISHSFGTYIVAKYLTGFDQPPVSFDTWILTGAVLNRDLDLDIFEGKAAKIINEIAPNDRVVDLADKGPFGSDPLFGNAGREGFATENARLLQRESEIFTHDNVIKRDVVAQRWMPWLQANVGNAHHEAIAKMMRQFR